MVRKYKEIYNYDDHCSLREERSTQKEIDRRGGEGELAEEIVKGASSLIEEAKVVESLKEQDWR
jgi:hypothetical protein